MEFLAFAFSLPMKYSNTIDDAIKIYRRWLNLEGEENRPACIAERENYYT